MPSSILFVCLGNICRSPLAEGIARSIAAKEGLDVVIDSCGTGSWHVGESPCESSVKVAEEHGVDISHQRARQIDSDDLDWFELIIALDDKNLYDLKDMGVVNVKKLGDYGYNGEDVPDPYFFPGYEGFDKVFEMIESCVIDLLTDKS